MSSLRFLGFVTSFMVLFFASAQAQQVMPSSHLSKMLAEEAHSQAQLAVLVTLNSGKQVLYPVDTTEWEKTPETDLLNETETPALDHSGNKTLLLYGADLTWFLGKNLPFKSEIKSATLGFLFAPSDYVLECEKKKYRKDTCLAGGVIIQGSLGTEGYKSVSLGFGVLGRYAYVPLLGGSFKATYFVVDPKESYKSRVKNLRYLGGEFSVTPASVFGFTAGVFKGVSSTATGRGVLVRLGVRVGI